MTDKRAKARIIDPFAPPSRDEAPELLRETEQAPEVVLPVEAQRSLLALERRFVALVRHLVINEREEIQAQPARGAAGLHLPAHPLCAAAGRRLYDLFEKGQISQRELESLILAPLGDGTLAREARVEEALRAAGFAPKPAPNGWHVRLA